MKRYAAAPDRPLPGERRGFMRWIATSLRDAVGLAGAAALAYGAWLFHPGAGFIVGGALALAGSWLLAIAERGEER